MFATLQDRLAATFKDLRGKGRLSDADIDTTTREIRVALLEADVALPVVKDFIAAVRERARGAEVHEALNPAQQVIKIVDEELVEILGGETRRLRFAKNPPTVIMLAGLQGSGKTTLAGKLAYWLKEQQHQPLLVAADLQRPNAVTQLQVVGERAGLPVFAPEPGNGVGDPVEVARRAVEHARQKLYDVVIVDTAGRLGIDEELMQQAADIRDAVSPDETLFVVDAMIGQDAVKTAQAFLDGVGFDGVVLTKLDGDARGGAALSVAKVTGRQVMFASAGEKVTDFDAFHPDRMASRILGMGDVLTLIEQAEKSFDKAEAEKMAGKFGRGEDFTFDDFLVQMEQLRKMGSISKLLGMLPGMGQMRDQIENIDEREIDRVTAMIRSMTPAERGDHKILNGSRRSRIARGSGSTVSDVNGLVERFTEAQKMVRQMGSGGGVPGMPGLPGAGRGKKAKAKTTAKSSRKTKGGRSGNPAKRALEQRQWEARQAGETVPPDLPEDFELPEELRNLLPPRLALTMPSVQPLHVRAVLLPDEAERDLWVDPQGQVSFEPVPGAETVVTRGFVVPGLVDAHCHVGLDAHGGVGPEVQEQQACADRDAGALLLRDAGSPADTRWVDDRADLPRLVRAGRHIARTKRYIRNYGAEVEPHELVEEVERQARRGDGWVKIVGDWIERDEGDLTPCWPAEVAAAAVTRAHELGLRMTAHCFGEQSVAELVAAGIDCIEHGTGLDDAVVARMAEQGTALVPTRVQLDNFPTYARQGEERFPAYAAHIRALHARCDATLRSAYDAGVPIYAGTDAGGVLPHGLIGREILALHDQVGLGPHDALGAGSWRARDWLGFPGLVEGASADLVAYDGNPLADLRQLLAPRAVVLRGRVVAPA